MLLKNKDNAHARVKTKIPFDRAKGDSLIGGLGGII